MNDLGLDRRRAEALRVAAPQVAAPQRRWLKPTLWPLELDGRRLLVKDYAQCVWPYRMTVGRLELRREERAYRLLAGLPFVGRCHGRLDRDALILERLDAVTLTRCPQETLRPQLFFELQAAIAAMHDRGLLHNDLRHRSNILVTPSGQLRLIDFGSSLFVGGRGRAARFLVRLLSNFDRSAGIKWFLRYFPDLLPAADREYYRRYLHWRRLWPGRNPRLERQSTQLRVRH